MKFFTKRLDTPIMRELFNSAQPFPHVVVDNLIDGEALSELVERYPDVKDKSWWHYDNPLERKYAFNDLSQLDEAFREFFDEANSPEVVAQLGRLADVHGLVADHALRGGGLHQIAPGGKLDVHEDFNVNLDMRAWRKLNMIVYLNEDWDESYGGHLQLWNADMTHCVKKVLPIFNRVVIFRTDMQSNHGHPDPLTCPVGRTRRSLATYYYVPMSKDEVFEYTSTQFKKRPEDANDPDLEELRAKRNKGRVSDKKT
jgi:Rps23 Pro-64 3,4-dihydroxylase Tpa1-like proline 4-hydroxylase